MSASKEWQEYLQALQALAQAPTAGTDRTARIDADLAAARQRADDDHDHVLTTRRRLDEQLDRVREAVDQTIHDEGIEPAGATAEVGLPPPTTIAEARSTLTRLERQLAEDQRGLADARNRAEQERLRRLHTWRLLLIAGGAGALLLLIVILAIALAG